jgi:hypothetical protein
MKAFQKLEIRGEKDHLVDFLTRIKSGEYENFTYVGDKSDDYAMMIASSKEYTATFLSTEIEGAIAYVWLVISDGELLYVSNITPNKSGQLTYNQYNAILKKFFNEVVEIQNSKGLSVTLSKGSVTIEDFAGIETTNKLKNWINSANPSTLNTHPLDFKRWCDFVFTAYLKKSNLTATQFERYLIEEVKIYDEELVSKVVLEYEYSLDLLSEYDKRSSL